MLKYKAGNYGINFIVRQIGFLYSMRATTDHKKSKREYSNQIMSLKKIIKEARPKFHKEVMLEVYEFLRKSPHGGYGLTGEQ